MRQAFAYGFDRDFVIRDAFKGTVAKTLTWIPPGYPGYDASETRFDYDLARARQLLAEAGYPGGKGLPEIKWEYDQSDALNKEDAEYVIRLYQKSLGVTIIPDPVDAATLDSLSKQSKTYPQISLSGWCVDYPDQQNALSIVWKSDVFTARALGYKNVEADRLMAAGDAETNPARRANDYAQAQKLIIGDAASIMQWNSMMIFLIKPYVKGLDFTPQDALPGLTTSLLNVTIER